MNDHYPLSQRKKLGREEIVSFLLSSGSFNMALSRAKTLAHPKKTPALQVTEVWISLTNNVTLFR